MDMNNNALSEITPRILTNAIFSRIDIKMFEMLVKKCKYFISEMGENHNTALHLAIKTSNTDFAKM